MISSLASIYKDWKFKRRMRSLVRHGMRIGKNVHIMPGAIFDEAYASLISIGDNCRIADGVRFLVHDASMYHELGTAIVGRIDIKENSFIGINASILPGVTIGPDAIVGAGCVVTKDVPSNSVVVGNPAQFICTKEEFLKKHKERQNTMKTFSYEAFFNEMNKDEISAAEFKKAYLMGGVKETNLKWLEKEGQ